MHLNRRFRRTVWVSLCSSLLLLFFVVGNARCEDSPFLNFDSETELERINNKVEKLVAEGRYEESALLANTAAEMALKEFGSDHVQYAKALNNRAWHEQTLGNYKQARLDFEKALAIYERVHGKESPQLATPLNNLALLLSFQGDYETALPLLERVLSLQVLALGTSHPELIYTLNNIAAVQSSLGRIEDSNRTSLRALDLKGVEDKAAMTQTLNNVATIAQKKNDLQTASKYLEEAVSLWSADGAAQAKPTPNMIEVYNNLALVRFGLSDANQARQHLGRALEITKSMVGDQHIDYATTLSNLAMIDYLSGDRTGARERFLQVADIVDHHISTVLPGLSFAEQRSFLAQKLPPIVSYLISSSMGEDNAHLQQAYSHIFRWKGLLIETLRWQSALAKEMRSSDASPDMRTLVALRRNLAAMFNNVGSVDFSQWQDDFKTMSRQKEELERRIASTSRAGTFSDVLANMTVGDFAKLLRDDEALVDLYEFDDLGAGRKSTYAAFLLDNAGTVQLIKMSPAALIDERVKSWRESVYARKNPQSESDELKCLTVGAFTGNPVVRDKARWFVSLDGELFRFPINIFTVSGTGMPEISQLDSPRELAYVRQFKHDAAGSDSKRMLVLGGVDFGKGGGSFTFAPLPGTIKEANAVMDMARKHGIEPIYMTGKDARKADLIEHLRKVDFAHLATHGIFSDRGMSLQEVKMTAASGIQQDKHGESARNPLLSSSLVLSAAKNAEGAEQPEMLTAEEVLNVDLHRANFLVLSACETGLGAKEVGQGILGLRASMMASGARTLIMSLWKVPDLPTTLLIEKFYENLFAAKQPPTTALRNAQSYVAGYADGAFRLPVNWGAWVLVGEGWPN